MFQSQGRVCVMSRTADFFKLRVTTCVESLEMSGILTAVSEMSGTVLKVGEMSEEKSC